MLRYLVKITFLFCFAVLLCAFVTYLNTVFTVFV